MEQWVPYIPIVLDEVSRHDGLGDSLGGSGLCPDCTVDEAHFKCNDCSEGVMRCSSCIVSFHQRLPLHRLQVRRYPLFHADSHSPHPKVWNGKYFEKATLESLGHIMNLAHPTNVCPVGPEIQRILVVDMSGYHYVRVRFCACSASSFLEPFRQLLRFQWYPASILRPKTVFTFDLLDSYHKFSMQGKLNVFDFYTSIMQKTDNRGHEKVKVCSSHF